MSIISDLMALREPALTVVAEEQSGYEARKSAEELVDIREQIVQLMSEARSIVRGLPRSLKGSAEAYWIPHIMIALGGEHEWMTAGHESTMQKTIEELEEYASDDEGGEHPDEKHDDPMGRHHGRNE